MSAQVQLHRQGVRAATDGACGTLAGDDSGEAAGQVWHHHLRHNPLPYTVWCAPVLLQCGPLILSATLLCLHGLIPCVTWSQRLHGACSGNAREMTSVLTCTVPCCLRAAFRLFDRMMLLLRGRVVYFGDRGALPDLTFLLVLGVMQPPRPTFIHYIASHKACALNRPLSSRAW